MAFYRDNDLYFTWIFIDKRLRANSKTHAEMILKNFIDAVNQSVRLHPDPALRDGKFNFAILDENPSQMDIHNFIEEFGTNNMQTSGLYILDGFSHSEI